MSLNSLCGNGPNYYGNRCVDLGATVTDIGRNCWILCYVPLSKTHRGDLEHILTKASLQKAKRIAIHFNNWEDSIWSLLSTGIYRKVRQTEEKNPRSTGPPRVYEHRLLSDNGD